MSDSLREAVQRAFDKDLIQRTKVMLDIAAEADRGAAKHGPFDYPDGTRDGGMNLVQRTQAQDACDRAAREGRVTAAHVLAEEFWEAMCEEDKAKLRTELVQVAAVSLKWIEKLDREMGR